MKPPPPSYQVLLLGFLGYQGSVLPRQIRGLDRKLVDQLAISAVRPVGLDRNVGNSSSIVPLASVDVDLQA